VIQSISSMRSFVLPNITRIKYGAGKITVPLKPSQIVHARFKHITAIPTNMNTEGIPVYKLRILDNLIERLIGTKGKAGEFIRLAPEKIDNLITQFRQELAYRNSSLKTSYNFNNVKPETGIILNVFA